jgi:hypothetical protein
VLAETEKGSANRRRGSFLLFLVQRRVRRRTKNTVQESAKNTVQEDIKNAIQEGE